MQRLLILLCFAFSIQLLMAQSAGNSHLQLYTTDNGLPSNGIKGMQWDETNEFLWMATEAGIVRFNGVDFKSYTKENMPDIASERMLFMVRNNAGNIYTADQPGNIFLIDKSKPLLWRKAAVNNNANPFLKQYYLLAVSDTFFSNKNNTIITQGFSAGSDKIICLSDTACLLLGGGRLFYYSINLKNPLVLSFVREPVSSIFKIRDQYFIVNNKKEIFLLSVSKETITPVPVTDVNGGLFKPAINNSLIFWQTGMKEPIAIDGEKAWQFTYDGNAIVAHLIFTGIPAGSYIKSVQYSEKNGLLFIGTESKGLIVISQNRVQSKKRKDVNSKNRNSYYSQIELPDGNILTNESDIIGDHNSTESELPVKGKFSFNISQTNDSLLWYNQTDKNPGYNCLHQYNKTTGVTKVYGKIKWGDIVAASGADIYLANPFGIGILDKDSLLVLYKYSKELAGVVTFDFTEISPGILAVATCAGLLRFNTKTHQLDTIFNKENICVRSIWKYKDYVFFGTYGSGFYIYKEGVIKKMPLDKNNYLLYTHCFVPDEEGYCWLSTNRGLFKCSLAELTNVFDNNAAHVYYHYFGKKDGMDMTELNGGCTPCALRLSNKTISFPTMDGLLWVNPEKAIPVLPEGGIYIDEILADNNKINEDSLAYKKLPAQTQEIIIKLGFSAWCNKENIYLEYQLNDTLKWKPVNTDNDAVIRLIGLNPGRYVLRIRKLNGFGVNNFSYKQIRFTIRTPWNQQWWFFILSCLVALGIAALYFSFRTRQFKIQQHKLEEQVAEKTKELQQQNEVLEKNNSIKTRLISIISHDIVTPLKFVTVAGKKLIEKRELMSEALQQETIQEITNTSQELQLLSTNILNWIKYQNENRRLAKETFNVHEMVNQVLGLLQSLARQKNLIIDNRIEKDLEIQQFYEPLKILVYNLLTNAIHFTEKGTITVSAIKEKEHTTISVKDEGIGMSPEQIQRLMAEEVVITSANVDNKRGHGLGYLIIKDLLKTMGAALHIESKKGAGATVSIIMGS